jgi:cation:H+ antiporter
MGDIVMIVLGLVLLVIGAEVLVRASAFIAIRLGVRPLFVGLTIVAAGTSAPELVASVAAALRGSSGIAVGNIVGSNITNVLLVCGVAALIRPVTVSAAALRRDGPVVLGAARTRQRW